MSIEDVRAAFERWHTAASTADEILVALNTVCADECVMHLQNGETGSREIAMAQASQARALYPDLSIDIEHVITTEDRVVVQVAMSGTPSLVFRLAQGRTMFHSNGAMIARVNDRAEIVEIWQYLNPGAVLTFPPSANPAPPPLADHEPGGEEDGKLVQRQWERATTGPEFLERIMASTLPDCLVHATNGEAGTPMLIEEHFRIMHAAIPDLTVEFEPSFVAGDRLISQFLLDGTQRGALGIAPPSGARVQSTGAIVARVTPEQRVQELWMYLAPGLGLIFPRRDR